eukprot:GILK01000712.1.p1 GENE.GILK01000712.1~~GILK01000712.1.p1  ORF type:complete len:552 (-),score=118.25 GILK01000712.1:311-1966(-)
MQAPVYVLNHNTKRETGRKAQLANIAAAKAMADIVRTTLGPRSMLKMLLDPMGGIVMTNDGNAILREVDVTHPAAKSMIELSRAQDEEVGDGTTSVIILAGEMLAAAEPFIDRQIHPTVVVNSYFRALEDSIKIANEIATPVDMNNRAQVIDIIKSCIGTKFVSRWGNLICDLALDAVMTVARDRPDGKKEVDIKRYAKVEKLPGGELSDCTVLRGVMFNKDITHPKMRRRIENPRVILLDCPLEYKKGESMTNVEIMKEDDWNTILKMEEEEVERLCVAILKFNPDVVITEKGVSDLAQHYLMKQNVSVIRRIRKTDNNRIARVSGATIVTRPEELQESDVGKDCGVFEVKKVGDEYFTFMTECKNPSACSILLRGASKDVLNEIERNLGDAMAVARNVILEPKLVPGGGALEMEISHRLQDKAKTLEGVQQWPYKAVASAFEVIPRTLAQNCGANIVRVITELRAKHAAGNGQWWGIDGNKGTIADMREISVWEPFTVRVQTFKTAIEAACMLLRIDDIVSGINKKAPQKASSAEQPQEEETFGDARDG